MKLKGIRLGLCIDPIEVRVSEVRASGEVLRIQVVDDTATTCIIIVGAELVEKYQRLIQEGM
jgi:hypothetical protein